MELIHLLLLGDSVVAACIFVQFNQMLNAEARKAPQNVKHVTLSVKRLA